MKKFKLFNLLLLTTLLSFTSCVKVETEKSESHVEESYEVSSTIDQLEQMGVLGTWKLSERSVNNISDLSVPCCDYFEFKKDAISEDLIGNFRAYGTGYEQNGVFMIDNTNSTIEFEYNNEQKSYGFQISGNVITFTYTEDNDNIVENWRREE